MEIDRMSYIFGSFARNKQNENVTVSKKRTILSKTSHDRSKSTPHTPKKTILVNPRAKSVCGFIVNEANFKCTMCQKLFIEPKVLPCFHTFCLRCLQELEANDFYTDLLIDTASTSRNSRKVSTGSNIQQNVTYHQNNQNQSIGKQIFCPTCGAQAEVPYGGVSFYPPNYLLQHRMVLLALNARSTNLLCDLCNSEVSATARCMDCALSFCESCKKGHLRQTATEKHEVLSLEEARTKGITKIRRQLMCLIHPDLELEFFCSTCSQVLCSYCVSVSHKGHSYEPVRKAAKASMIDFRFSFEKAKSIAEQSALTANRLLTTAKTIESQCENVELEIVDFIDKYVESIQDHKTKLLKYVNEVKIEKLQEINKRKLELHRKVKEARDVAFFLDELLNEGSDAEVMSFFKPVMKKISEYREKGEIFNETNIDANLLFLPQEIVQNSNSICPLYGVITTQIVSPEHCTLITQGLNNLRVGKRATVILEAKDKNGMKVVRGGEKISGDICYKNASGSKYHLFDVEDNRDGTYNISFVPDLAGKLMLNININGHSIKHSPFPITVQSSKPHHGTFHCCSFCSSGGNKEVSCGCEGKMPGGYKGCGHGHEGHPGRRHWSCCGNILENSECIKQNNSHYQFTL